MLLLSGFYYIQVLDEELDHEGLTSLVFIRGY